ncbi:MAG: hypothetical protein JW727_04000, partial [Candidatus Aenigmarchaeota archaeon]|nr:hypothetical protein [Candidatus Aenigmarchaeota archaeon]
MEKRSKKSKATAVSDKQAKALKAKSDSRAEKAAAEEKAPEETPAAEKPHVAKTPKKPFIEAIRSNEGHMKKISLAFSLLAVILIFWGAFSVRMATADEQYLLGADDPFYWSRLAQYIVDGNIPEYDQLRLHPEYEPLTFGLFPYFVAWSYNIVHAVNGVDFYRFLFWVSPFFAALAVFPAFWIGKELHSNKAGIFAAFFVGFTPSFLFRSMAGYLDTDCFVVFFSMLVVALFLAAYNRVDTKNWKKPAPIILAILAGVSMALFALVWSGFSYMPWLFAGLFGFQWVYNVFLAEGSDIKNKVKNSMGFFKSHVLIYALMFLAFLATYYPMPYVLSNLSAPDPIQQVIGVTSFFQTAKAEGGIFPNVWISISEEMSASFSEVVGRVHPVIFGFGLLGLIFLMFLFFQNLGKKSIYPETFFFMFIWIAPTLYGSLWAVRFTQLLALPMAICAGLAVAIIFDAIFRLENYGDNKALLKKASWIIAALFSVFLLYALVLGNDANYTSIYKADEMSANSFGSGATSGWVTSMSWLKNNSAECSVVATYWDPGYLIASLSERTTVYDGGTQNNQRVTSIEDLNGLDCMKDRQGYLIDEEGLSDWCDTYGTHSSVYCSLIGTPDAPKQYCVTSRMQDMAGALYTSDEVKAAKVLESYLGDCTEIYFLASNDLIGKSTWWTYFSNWDPVKGQGTAYPYSMSGLTGQKQLMLENGTALEYGPFYLKITVKDGMQKVEPLLLQNGMWLGIKALIFYDNGTAVRLDYPDAPVPGVLWVDPTFRLVIYMPAQTENSMFTRMFFFEGEGFEYFEKVYSNSEIKLFKLNLEKLKEDYPEVK